MTATEALFRTDAYRQCCRAKVIERTGDGAVVLDRTVFYATGGGQPGDSGRFTIDGETLEVQRADYGEGGRILHHLASPAAAPEPGIDLDAEIDWDIRYRRMRMHTAMHLLSVVLPFPVTGGSVGEERSRLDFDMPDPLDDRDAVDRGLATLIAADAPVNEVWVDARELDERPELVKTVRVRPPTAGGRVRLVRIGPEESPVDLQPCGGTHVRRTSEIGAVRIGKVEKKGRNNRRVTLVFDE